MTTAQSRWPDHATFGVLLALFSAACFGTLAIFGKLAEDVGLNTSTLLVFRFLIGTALLWLGLAVSGRAQVLPRRSFLFALSLGLIYALYTAFYFWGLLFIPAGLTGLVFYTYPVYVYLLAIWLLDESISRSKLGALVVALSGVALIVGGDLGEIDIAGVGLVLLSALGIAGYIVGSRAALGTIESGVLAGTALAGTSAFFLAFGFVSGRLGRPVGLDQWLVVVGIASIGTAAPTLLYLIALNRIQASHASVLGTAEPLVTVILGIVILGESLKPVLVIGGVLILAGVIVIQTDVGNKKVLAE